MRIAVMLMLALALNVVAPVLAKSENAPPGQPAPKQEKAEDKAADKAEKTESKADRPDDSGRNDAKAGNSGNGRGSGGPAARQPDKPDRPQGANGAGKTAKAAPAVPVDQNEALLAVESQEALPLAQIVGTAEQVDGRHVVNAKLLRVQGILLYQLTMLDDAGRSWRSYYYARSGNPVRIN